jgi:hypothetical protein
MSFKIGSYVEWKDTKGYIRFISDQYISICVNVDSDAFLDCCVICYSPFWNEVVVCDEIPPVFPIMNPAKSIR